VEFVGFGLFFLIWGSLMLASFGGIILAVSALVSISRQNPEAFGPWWDNTKSAWMIGIAVSFALPFGTLITGVYWFWKGKEPIRTTGLALRPFWVGPPKPMPMWPPYGGYPPYGHVPPPQQPYAPEPPPPPSNPEGPHLPQ
jgi:hypothetical protein